MNDINNKISQNINSFNPDLKSVLGEMQEGHYLIIIADRKKAFLFLFDKGDVQICKEIMDPGVRKDTKQSAGELYGKSNKLSHHIDNQLHHHLQLIAEEINHLIAGKHINGVFIGGHKMLFAAIEKVLPADLQNKLRGEFITELNIPSDELIRHCRRVLEEYNKK